LCGGSSISGSKLYTDIKTKHTFKVFIEHQEKYIIQVIFSKKAFFQNRRGEYEEVDTICLSCKPFPFFGTHGDKRFMDTKSLMRRKHSTCGLANI